MKYLRFRLNVVFRCLLLVGLAFLFFKLVYRTDFYVTAFVVAVVILALITNLLHYTEHTMREVSRFIMAIRNSDVSQSFKGKQRIRAFKELARGLDDILENFRRTRFEKEAQSHYLDVVVQHVGVALIAFDENGEVSLFNEASQALFGLPKVRNLTALRESGSDIDRRLLKLAPGQRELIEIDKDDQVYYLSVDAVQITQQGVTQKLVSIQDIRGELEEKELEAWQRLISVLTHEINNSITPISSLAETVHGLFRDEIYEHMEEDPEQIGEDILNALAVIQKRSQGLVRFVEDYRRMTNIPTPNLSTFAVQDLFNNMEHLLGRQLNEAGIVLTCVIEPQDLKLSADFHLLEQIVINLVKNAERALAGRPAGRIVLRAGREGERTLIRVTDNGKGIVAEALDKIFIPFFKLSGDGSGIGLSFARVVMRRHGGSISATSEPDQGTEFTLKF